MLNLSDKELDRLSREAAELHDPGDLTGTASWNRLEWRLDRELGKISSPNSSPLHALRRIPFYYAPVVVLLVGVGVAYFASKAGRNTTPKTSGLSAAPAATPAEPSGSPPLAVVKPLDSGQTRNNNASTNLNQTTYNATSTPQKESTATAAPSDATGNAGTNASAGSSVANNPAASAAASSSSNKGLTTGSAGSATANAPAPSGATSHALAPGSSNTAAPYPATGSVTSGSHHHRRRQLIDQTGSSAAAGNNTIAQNGQTAKHVSNQSSDQANQPADHNRTDQTSDAASSSDINNSSASPAKTNAPRALLPAAVSSPHSLAKAPDVDDTQLRKWAAKGGFVASPIRIDKTSGPAVHINRPLQFGLLVAPDFSSVNSLAGDRPGSSLGVTIDYEFVNGLYLSTGALFTRKIYAALPENYHVPMGYFQSNNIHDVSLIKGSFNMLEIPLNLRYDFKATGNTMFFVSAGTSSYLFAKESSQYYFDLFGRQACQNFPPGGPGQPGPHSTSYLFAAVNLSMGVEAGISNNLSLVIAPYMKIPTAGIGFGEVQLNSIGVNFGLKYSPVLSRKRH